MSELYQNLLNRYSNSIKYIDSNGLKGIILFNEPIFTIRKMWVTTKYNKNEPYIDIIEFVKDAIAKGFDWRLYGQPEWESIKPKKKKKFMKPKKRKI